MRSFRASSCACASFRTRAGAATRSLKDTALRVISRTPRIPSAFAQDQRIGCCKASGTVPLPHGS
eukprot:3956833-Prymnesium_polylepis.1